MKTRVRKGGDKEEYRELVKQGMSRDLAWNKAKPVNGARRLSRSPGLAFAVKSELLYRA